MRDTLALLRERAPDLEVDGEMHGDVALDANLRREVLPDSTLKGDANLLVLPNIDAANISYNLLKTAAGNNIAIGPMLLGAAQAGACADGFGDGAPDRQHDGVAGGGRNGCGAIRVQGWRGLDPRELNPRRAGGSSRTPVRRTGRKRDCDKAGRNPLHFCARLASVNRASTRLHALNLLWLVRFPRTKKKRAG